MNYCYLPNLEAGYNSMSRHSGFFNLIKYLSFVPNIKQKKKYISESGRTDTSVFCFTSSPEAHSHLPFVPCPYDVTFCFNKGYRLSLHVPSITKFQLHVGCVWAFFVCVSVSQFSSCSQLYPLLNSTLSEAPVSHSPGDWKVDLGSAQNLVAISMNYSIPITWYRKVILVPFIITKPLFLSRFLGFDEQPKSLTSQ